MAERLERNANGRPFGFEFRITRPQLYRSCEGTEGPEARQGHYITAASIVEAVQKMAAQYEDCVFDVQLWRTEDGQLNGRAALVVRYSRTGWCLDASPAWY